MALFTINIAPKQHYIKNVALAYNKPKGKVLQQT